MAVYLIYDGLHPLNPGNVCHFVNSMYLSECRWNCSCDCTTKCILFHNHSHSNGKQEKMFRIMQEKREMSMNIAVLRIVETESLLLRTCFHWLPLDFHAICYSNSIVLLVLAFS